MTTTWLTADTHFGHENAIAHNARPYLDIRTHDAALIASWNARVRPRDEIWHLGDFALGLDDKALATLFRRLHGRKHLVIGNHDRAATLRLPWSSAPRQIREVTVEDHRLVLCHYALRTWRGIHRGAVHVYGHTHGRIPGTRHSEDAGVDAWDYGPVCLSELLARMAGNCVIEDELRLAANVTHP